MMKYKSDLLNFLDSRLAIKDCSDFESLDDFLHKGKKLNIYFGFDLTASSLHVGHISNLINLNIFKQFGHNIILLYGSATTRIGDPWGKDKIRKMLSSDEIEDNKQKIKKTIMQFLSIDFMDSKKPGKIIEVDNYDWFKNINYIDFLRNVGINFSVNKMLSMDFVKERIVANKPLSFIEFNYPLFQGYDFLHLCQKYECNMQIGGSDQWGNMITGLDLINKVLPEKKAYVLTRELITRSDGKKMGKTENGAVWIDKNLFSPFEYFQYFRNVGDADVEKFLKIFTYIDIEDITQIVKKDINIAKEKLAFEITKITHGETEALKALKTSEEIFKKTNSQMINSNEIPLIEIQNGTSMIDLLKILKISNSNSELKKIIKNKGIKLNDQVVEKINLIFDKNFIEKKNNGKNIFIISKGKKSYFKIKIN